MIAKHVIFDITWLVYHVKLNIRYVRYVKSILNDARFCVKLNIHGIISCLVNLTQKACCVKFILATNRLTKQRKQQPHKLHCQQQCQEPHQLHCRHNCTVHCHHCRPLPSCLPLPPRRPMPLPLPFCSRCADHHHRCRGHTIATSIAVAVVAIASQSCRHHAVHRHCHRVAFVVALLLLLPY